MSKAGYEIVVKDVHNLKTDSWTKRLKGRNAEMTFSVHCESPSDTNKNSLCKIIKESCNYNERIFCTHRPREYPCYAVVNRNTSGVKKISLTSAQGTKEVKSDV